MMQTFTIGVDFGTDSVRALLVDTQTGACHGTCVHYYERWQKGLFCDPTTLQFRQHPLDYLEGLEASIKGALAKMSEEERHRVVGISIDTTGSTPVAVDSNGNPLALLPEFSDNPNAMFILWKDHTANTEAEEINNLAHNWAIDYTKYVGGLYSSEWFWAKILHTIRIDEKVRENAFSWVEHCDWISAILTGSTNPLTIRRSRCAAGHKALWHEEFDGLPCEDFLVQLDPALAGIRSRLFENSFTSDLPTGTISEAWALKLGLSEKVVIGVGTFDCHAGAVGAEIQPYEFVRVMGTSTCDMLIAPNEEMGHLLIKGICGQVNGSILPGMIGMEAGQSAYGDYYAWFQQLVAEPVRSILGDKAAEDLIEKLIPFLSKEAEKLPITDSDIVATDWINGRRTPDANHTLKASFTGMGLGTNTIQMFKMIVEATAFGSKAIVDRFIEQGVPIKQVVAIGGVAKKSPYVMQTLSDVLNMPIKVVNSDQACALGAAMYASVAAGIHADLVVAQKAMGSGVEVTYFPRPNAALVYEKLYVKYQKLGKFTESYA